MNRQQYKEACCYWAIRKGYALARRGLEVHAISAAGHTKLISSSNTQETVWQDAYKKLKPETQKQCANKVDPYTLPTKGWDDIKVDPDTGFAIKSE